MSQDDSCTPFTVPPAQSVPSMMLGARMNWPEQWEQQMWQTNLQINQLPYASDAEQWGKADFWDNIEDTGKGDCDSYAIGKLRRLAALGWPIERLHLATCWVETGEYHAVLVVETPLLVGYILDNRQADPYPVYRMHALRCIPHQIQAIGGLRGWRQWKFSAPPVMA